MNAKLTESFSLKLIDIERLQTSHDDPLFQLTCKEAPFAEFKREAEESFCLLPPDVYDISQQAAVIISERARSSKEKINAEDLLTCRTATNVLDVIRACGFNKYISNDEVLALRHRRSRAIAKYKLIRSQGRWQTIREPNVTDFKQSTHDYRTIPRKFAAMLPEIANSSFVLGFLLDIAKIVEAVTSTSCISVTVHQVRGIAIAKSNGDNSPEGVHRDGNAYVIPALVITRHLIKGGVSRVFAPDGSTLVYSKCLYEGQALLHADNNQSFMHDVTPFHIDATDADCPKSIVGIRDILGFDIDPREKS